MFVPSLFISALAFTGVLGATIDVQVGAGGQKVFEPNNIKAALGDIVSFKFVAGNHTATQSTFAAPCSPAGFRSGFKPVATGGNSTFSIMINSTDPVWVYCAQSGHCQSGMVMAINAADTGDKTFAAFQAAAQGSSSSTSNTSTTTDSGSGTSTTGSSGSSTSATSAGSSGSTASSSSTASGGATVLGVSSATGLLALIVSSFVVLL